MNIDTGDKNWVSDIGGAVISTPLLDDNENKSIYLVTKVDSAQQSKPSESGIQQPASMLRSISQLTGLTIWQTEVSAESQVFLYNFKDKIVFIDKNGNAASINKADGKKVWQKSFKSFISAEPLVNDEILIVALAEEIVFISMENAATVFRTKIPERVDALAFSDRKLYWGDAGGGVYGYSPDKKKKRILWKFQNGAAVSHIIYTSAGLLVTSFDNFAYMLDARSGKTVWKKRFPGRIVLKPLVARAAAAVTSVGSSELIVLNLRNGKIVDQISLPLQTFFTSAPILVGKFLLFADSDGVYGFSNKIGSGNCAPVRP